MIRLSTAIGWLAVVGVVYAGTAGAAEVVEGATGPGARYGLAMPDSWNGDLVVYAHGIVDPAADVVLPSTQDNFLALRAAWLARGFAVAYSSYSENGYALKDAIQRLHQLTGLFSARFGPPNRVYLAGHSLGAAAVQVLAEQYPSQYAGSLAMCGPLSGSQLQIQYLGDVRVLFDYYFPGVLEGDVNTVGDAIVFAPGQPEFQAVLTALIGGFPNRTIQFALAARLPFTTAAEAVQGAMTAIGFSLRFTNDLLSRTHGHPTTTSALSTGARRTRESDDLPHLPTRQNISITTSRRRGISQCLH
jgi:pimeloyl-ACP methyl ester carboxylesterase